MSAMPSPVGARVKFRDDHPDYPGMVGTVVDDITLPGMEPTVGVLLDAVPATADEIEPFVDDESSYLRNVVRAEYHLSEVDQDAVRKLLSRDPSQTSTGVDDVPADRGASHSAPSAATDAGRAADAPGPSCPSTFPSDGA